jgi:hypothetical protein
MDYLMTALGFITGGGMTAIFSVRYVRKNTKLDYADKAIKFMEGRQDKMQEQVKDLETRIDDLEQISCIRHDCTERINPFKKTG